MDLRGRQTGDRDDARTTLIGSLTLQQAPILLATGETGECGS